MTARILVADGQAMNRIMLKVRLEMACYQVAVAGSSAQLLEELRAAPPGLILLGSGFCDIDPIALCAALTSDQDAAGIPVIMLADAARRLDGLRAGASTVLDPNISEQMLLTRIRGLLRDADTLTAPGMAEAPAGFAHSAGKQAQITLVADSAGRAMCWKHFLGQRLPYHFTIRNPDETLSDAASGRYADLYLIAADIDGRGDGLRLMSELRSRSGSRDAAFVISTDPERAETNAVALDLGAGDVLPVQLDSGSAEAAALMLQAQISRKLRGDKRRAEAQRNLVWAMTDPLTGLYNRRYALPQLGDIAVEAKRCETRFATLVMDLDCFKGINDRHGHAAGDAVLSEVAHRLNRTIGPTGTVARIGGEEFLAVLPDSDEASACALAEQTRNAIEARPILLPGLSGGGAIRVTLSVGVALLMPEDIDLFRSAACAERVVQRVLERADQALIQAKKRGRNRVVLAQSE